MEKNWGNSSIVKWKLYCDVNIFQENALKLEILYNTRKVGRRDIGTSTVLIEKSQTNL
jgi:hypothetical protein